VRYDDVNVVLCKSYSLELLNAKIYDPDEKVRAAACKVYSHLDYESALHHVSEEQLRSVVGRGLDKKVCGVCHFYHG